MYDADPAIATVALQLYTNIALSLQEDVHNTSVCSETLNAGVSLLNTLQSSSCPSSHYKIPLVACVLLARCSSSLAASLTTTLVNLVPTLSSPESSLLVCIYSHN